MAPSTIGNKFCPAGRVVCLALFLLLLTPAATLGQAAATGAARLKSAVIDYPEDGSVFPPGVTPPTFFWRDAVGVSWHIDINFEGGGQPVHSLSNGERMTIGPIDPRCVAPTNRPPALTPRQAEAWVWRPTPEVWAQIEQRSTDRRATLIVTGYAHTGLPVSQARASFTTSTDPVGAPIFYRDVPLMPTANTDGTVQPIPPGAMHLIQWRLRDIRKPESHTVLTDAPTCLNCHSFARDGKTMGIDVDGPNNDKGLWAMVPVEKTTRITDQHVVQWNTDSAVGKTRVGFMTQVSPDGRYAISTFAGTAEDFQHTYYVRNFADYRFLQVFYPTKGILEWYDQRTGKRHPLPGADDPQYIQTGGVWSPDGKWVVFCRALARAPRVPGQPDADYALDPKETQIQYDLYRVPFNDGLGGTAERITGASQNRMSNSMPKVSPDGRWIVWVESKNGMVMRPDSQLYIVPFAGGAARRLRANTSLMNSWHSWSPNGRWLVFSSKSRSPYTQMYLTHIDAEGNSSPAILVDNATASNRAVNLPEFVNIAGDGIEQIEIPAVELYRYLERAINFEERGDFPEALEALNQAAVAAPDDARIFNDLGSALYRMGRKAEAIEQTRKAVQMNPALAEGHFNLGSYLMAQGRFADSVPEIEAALELNPRCPGGESALGTDLMSLRRDREALHHFDLGLRYEPGDVSGLIGVARILASSSDPTLRNGIRAIKAAEQARALTESKDPMVLDTLSAAYAEAGRFDSALATAQQALTLATAVGNSSLAQHIRQRIQLFSEGKPFRN